MGKTWDGWESPAAFQRWCLAWAREVWRVLKPGGFMVAFGGTRTVHRLTCAIEDAGFEIRDGIDWIYGCLDDQTEIMVDGQWEPYHKVKRGHLALGYEIERDEFSWQPIQRVVVFPYSDTAYRLVGDHTDQLVTRAHRCIVERGGSYVFEEAQEAARERQARVPVLEDVRGLLDALPLPRGSRPDQQRSRQPVAVQDEPGPQTVRGARHTSADLVRIEPEHYDGIAWCVTVPTRAFVARRNGKIFVTGNSGFPKSLDVSKAIDKAAGVEREVVGTKLGQPGYHLNPYEAAGGALGQGINGRTAAERLAASQVTAPATEGARTWAGWGTALKPAREPIVVARKPLAGTVAANVLAYGTGALNINACRAGEDTSRGDRYNGKAPKGGGLGARAGRPKPWSAPAGRWPSNVVLSHVGSDVDGDLCADGCLPGCPVAELDRQSGESVSGRPSPNGRYGEHAQNGVNEVYGVGLNSATPNRPPIGDSGGASRFFPVFRYEAKAPTAERPRVAGTAHPTVKPLALMRWLVRLVTPPGGIVLEPFAGSGTTAEACVLEGVRCIAIEREAAYLPLIVARLAKPVQPPLNIPGRH